MANRDPEATKAKILAAAVREFSAKGISGARVDAIAARARVNKRMLYYYFESKEGLFREILRRRLAEGAAKLSASNVSHPDRLAERTARLPGQREWCAVAQVLRLGARKGVEVPRQIEGVFSRADQFGQRFLR